MNHDDLKQWREKNGYTQNDLAQALFVNVMTVSRWERKIRSIPPFLHLALRCLELQRINKRGTDKGRRNRGAREYSKKRQ